MGKGRGRHPQLLSGILREALGHLRLDKRVEELSVLFLWDRVVGPQIAKRSSAVSVFDHVLYVNVSDNVWMHQLYLHKATILGKIARQVGMGVIRDISFRIGKIEPPPRRRKTSMPPALEEIELDPGTVEEIDSALAGLSDEELRADLRRVMLKDAKLKVLRSRRSTIRS